MKDIIVDLLLVLCGNLCIVSNINPSLEHYMLQKPRGTFLNCCLDRTNVSRSVPLKNHALWRKQAAAWDTDRMPNSWKDMKYNSEHVMEDSEYLMEGEQRNRSDWTIFSSGSPKNWWQENREISRRWQCLILLHHQLLGLPSRMNNRIFYFSFRGPVNFRSFVWVDAGLFIDLTCESRRSHFHLGDNEVTFIDPSSGHYLSQRSQVTCKDWINSFAQFEESTFFPLIEIEWWRILSPTCRIQLCLQRTEKVRHCISVRQNAATDDWSMTEWNLQFSDTQEPKNVSRIFV